MLHMASLEGQSGEERAMTLWGLSEKGRQVWQYLVKGIREGKSGAEIMRELRELGLGYRLQDFYNDLRIIRGEELRWDTLKYVRRDRVISEDLYSLGNIRKDVRFLTTFEIEIEDLETRQRKTVYVTVGHDIPMRREDLEEIALSPVLENVSEYEGWVNFRVTKVTPVKGLRRA